jgi:squalene synthase HpnC
MAMSVGHYENFPVASVLLPRPLRRPVAVIYRFARSADDFADEGDRPASERLALLERYRDELRRLAAGRAPADPFFEELREVITAHDLPIEPFHDLLDAFSQDVTQSRYASFAEVMDYCRRSADPIGRLMLRLYRQSCDVKIGDEHVVWSDSICSALQLVNFWQDVEIDFAKDRIYLPQDEMARFGVSERQVAQRDAGGGWAALMQFQVERARAMLGRGAPLALALPGRIGLEIRTVVQGGLRILEKIERVRGDVFRRRPVLRAWDWPLMLSRALSMRRAK